MLYVLLDNGHGQDTMGKRSPQIPNPPFEGCVVYEYDITRKIVGKIVNRLHEEKDIQPVIVTPERYDVSLQERVRRINNYVKRYGVKNCIMISVHLNAAGNGKEWMKATGWECYTTKGQNNSDKLAECLYDAAEGYGLKTRKDSSDGDKDKEAQFYIIKGANCPAVLTENLFMDNLNEARYLLTGEGQNTIVNLHIEGIKKYYNKRI